MNAATMAPADRQDLIASFRERKAKEPQVGARNAAAASATRASTGVRYPKSVIDKTVEELSAIHLARGAVTADDIRDVAYMSGASTSTVRRWFAPTLATLTVRHTRHAQRAARPNTLLTALRHHALRPAAPPTAAASDRFIAEFLAAAATSKRGVRRPLSWTTSCTCENGDPT